MGFSKDTSVTSLKVPAVVVEPDEGVVAVFTAAMQDD